MTPADDDAHALAQASARAMLARDRTAAMLEIELESVTPGHAVLAMTVGDAAINGHAIAHGGALFTLADTAFAIACNSRDVPHVALDASISFVRAARAGDRLRAAARERSLRARTGTYEVEIHNEAGDLIALFTATCYRVRGSVIAGPDGSAHETRSEAGS